MIADDPRSIDGLLLRAAIDRGDVAHPLLFQACSHAIATEFRQRPLFDRNIRTDDDIWVSDEIDSFSHLRRRWQYQTSRRVRRETSSRSLDLSFDDQSRILFFEAHPVVRGDFGGVAADDIQGDLQFDERFGEGVFKGFVTFENRFAES